MKHLISILAAAVLFGLATPAQAIDEPENVIKYRQSVMKAIGGHMGAIVSVVKGEVSYIDHVPIDRRRPCGYLGLPFEPAADAGTMTR